ncbi:NDP-hexose 2,3-dehydratase family protein [Actinophytocola xanthii]|uniref:NDP-hexose 2,3-dehydratase n=1 Tax=Actinophytocola xanthii TaxID=1912961 RepID=A0A1Q8CS75_9PSEU|nr:NDP-hexose 2,3-dehydratase family protein [Actinophytocola xanthii]OLF17186.1 NDP-hexose 2,3-dehydratase [Actinophytocola xanthii]
MTTAGRSLLRKPDDTLAERLAYSARTVDNGLHSMDEVRSWLADRSANQVHRVERIPFEDLRRWRFDEDSGDLHHDSGKFFRIQGLRVESDYGPVPAWTQPIINQPEIGILGILVREIDGVLHCLLQAKSEPGNPGGVQVSPTVQATRSNYLRVHEGGSVPYLDRFRDLSGGRVLADVLQSEQGSWFYRKRNRNMIVEVDDEVEPLEDFCWLTLGQVHRLLAEDNVVNMDARTVLSCMPGGFEGGGEDGGEVTSALLRSCDPAEGGLSTSVEMMSWITSRESEHTVRAELIGLNEVRQWKRTSHEIQHERGLFFTVIAVAVLANSREVGSWTQPLLMPCGTGAIALLVKRVDGVLHALVSARAEPGYHGTVELAPTVQCTPDNYEDVAPEKRPPFLDLVLGRDQDRVLFDTELSEEGGRFYHARNRYQIIEVDADFPDGGRPDFRWLTVHQLNGLLRHSNYVNVQARTLVACLRGLR